MDFPRPPLSKSSFKSRHSRRTSSCSTIAIDRVNLEQTPILYPRQQHINDLDEKQPHSAPASSIDVIISNSVSNSYHSSSTSSFVMRKEHSFDHSLRPSPSPSGAAEDPPTKLLREFFDKQSSNNNNNDEIALEVDPDLDEISLCTPSDQHQLQIPRSYEQSPFSKRSSREVRVSFEPSVSGAIDSAAESIRRRYKDDANRSPSPLQYNQQRTEEVLRCTSNALRKEASLISRGRTQSRILDPTPEEVERMSGRIPKSGILKSAQIRSGMMSGGIMSRRSDDGDSDDDPLDGIDLPEEYRKAKIDIWTVMQWLSLMGIIAALACTLSISSLRDDSFLDLKLWKWEALLLALICGRLVSGWVIKIIVFFIERNFILRKRVLYFVYGLKRAVQNCLWLGFVLLAWHLLFDKRVWRRTKSPGLKYVTKVLVCFLVANFVWLLKTLLVKVLASSFHVSTYFDRIQESVFNQFVIETLSGPPLVELYNTELEEERTVSEVRKLQNAGAPIPNDLKDKIFPPRKSGTSVTNSPIGKSGRSIGKSGRSIGKSVKMTVSGPLSKRHEDQGFTIDHLHKLNPKNVSAWNMKRLMKIVKKGSLSTLDEQIIGGVENTAEIRSETEAKAAARKIFYNVARPNAKYIYFEDLLRFMREDEASRAMGVFEGGSDSKISKSSLKNWVVNAFRERRALSLTLNDTKTAVNRLHQLVNFIVGIIIIIIWLLILGIATSKFFVVLGSQIVVVSFIFGNTAKTLFESIIFLFVIHPFDVGDRCEVDGVLMLVEEMNILTTVFLRGSDNQKVVYPNSVLASRPIGNFYRSPDQGDAVDFYIHICTPAEKLAEMKQRITSYIEGKKEHFYPGPMLVVLELVELNKVKVAIWFRHRMNFQDIGEKFVRRSTLIEEIVGIFKELDIQYRLYPIDINVKTVTSFNDLSFDSQQPTRRLEDYM